jgi:hypothetical protein
MLPLNAECKEGYRIGRSPLHPAFFCTHGHGCRHDGVESDQLRRTDRIFRRLLFHRIPDPKHKRPVRDGAANHPIAIVQPLAPAATRSPTICTAMTFTMVIDGKIIAYPMSGRSVGAIRVE